MKFGNGQYIVTAAPLVGVQVHETRTHGATASGQQAVPLLLYAILEKLDAIHTELVHAESTPAQWESPK